MKYWWQSFNGALSKEECDFIVQYALTHKPQEAVVGHGGKATLNKELRRSTVRWLKRDDPALLGLFLKIENMATKANANGFGFDLAGFHEIQFTEYDADDSGGYGWHEDLTWKTDAPFQRKMSMVIQLSERDAYTGGKLLLKNDPLPAGTFENQGDVIFFPSFNTHSVTPVKLGKRYSLVTWFVGSNFR
jgi:PKHD-type hydroxylase